MADSNHGVIPEAGRVLSYSSSGDVEALRIAIADARAAGPDFLSAAVNATQKECTKVRTKGNVNFGSYRPLHFAAYNDLPEVAELLIECDMCDAAAVTVRGDTALHIAAASRSLRVLRLLLQHCTSTSSQATSSSPSLLSLDLLQQCNNWGECPLHLACANSWANGIKELLETNEGAAQVRDKWGRSPVTVLSELGDTTNLGLFRVRGLDIAALAKVAPPTTDGDASRPSTDVSCLPKPLQEAVRTEFMEKVRCGPSAAKKPPVEAAVVRGIFKETQGTGQAPPLAIPSHRSAVTPVQQPALSKLLEFPAPDAASFAALMRGETVSSTPEEAHTAVPSLTGKDFFGVTALMKLAAWNRCDLIDLLIPALVEACSWEQYLAHLNSSSPSDGFTALHHAAEMGARDAYGRLLSVEGLDLTMRDKTGRSAMEIAGVRGIVAGKSDDRKSGKRVTKPLPRYATPAVAAGTSVRVPMCKFFLAGRCRRGKSCRFSHRSESDADGSANFFVKALAPSPPTNQRMEKKASDLWPVGLLTDMSDEPRPYDLWEGIPDASQERWQDVTLKKYRRSAAGCGPTSPSKLRTDATLGRCVSYILDTIADADLVPSERVKRNFERSSHCGSLQAPDLLDMWLYAWDRLRAVRVDYTEQHFGVLGERWSQCCITAFERMARFHIITHHELLGFESECSTSSSSRSRNNHEASSFKSFAMYSKHSEDSVTSILATLWVLYRTAIESTLEGEKLGDSRGVASTGLLWMRHIPQCLGFMIIWNVDSGDGLWLQGFLRELLKIDQRLTSNKGSFNISKDEGTLLQSAPVKFAMAVATAVRRRDFSAFFTLLRTAPDYVSACAMAKYAIGIGSSSYTASGASTPSPMQTLLDDDRSMRGHAVRSLWKAWAHSGRHVRVPLVDLAAWLGFYHTKPLRLSSVNMNVNGRDGRVAFDTRDRDVELDLHATAEFLEDFGILSEGLKSRNSPVVAGDLSEAVFAKAVKGGHQTFVAYPYRGMAPTEAGLRVRPLPLVAAMRQGRPRGEICKQGV